MKVTRKENGGEAYAGTQARFVTPRTDIVETKDAYVVKADLPGVSKENLEINIDQDELSIVGHRKTADTGKTVYRETAPFSYRRVFTLEALVDRDKVKAKLENGVLRLELPKAEAHKPKKILVS